MVEVQTAWEGAPAHSKSKSLLIERLCKRVSAESKAVDQ